MYKSHKEKAELENKELKQELEQSRQKIQALEIDRQKLSELEDLAEKRDTEAASFLTQHKELTMTISRLTQDWEHTEAEKNSLQETLAEYEADLEHEKHENAKQMGHANHKQKVQYHIKVKDENMQLKKDIVELRQRLSQFEAGQRGSSLLEALAAFGGSGNGGAGELSVSAPSVTPARHEPRTPNPKGSSQSAARTPRRPNSAGPAPRRGQAVEVENCQRCAIQERATERTIMDFQHVISLIERAAFVGDVGDRTGDPHAMIEKLRNVVAGGAHSHTTRADPVTPGHPSAGGSP